LTWRSSTPKLSSFINVKGYWTTRFARVVMVEFAERPREGELLRIHPTSKKFCEEDGSPGQAR
jgi:hypothetical protein